MDINTWMDMEVTHSSYWVTKEMLSTASSMWRYSVWVRCSVICWIKAMHNCNKCSALLLLATSVRSCCSGTCSLFTDPLFSLFRDCRVCVWKCSLLHAYRFSNRDQLFQPKLWKVLARKCTAVLVMYLNFSLINGQAQNLWKTKQSILFILILWHSLHRNGLVIRAFDCRAGDCRFDS